MLYATTLKHLAVGKSYKLYCWVMSLIFVPYGCVWLVYELDAFTMDSLVLDYNDIYMHNYPGDDASDCPID